MILFCSTYEHATEFARNALVTIACDKNVDTCVTLGCYGGLLEMYWLGGLLL